MHTNANGMNHLQVPKHDRLNQTDKNVKEMPISKKKPPVQGEIHPACYDNEDFRGDMDKGSTTFLPLPDDIYEMQDHEYEQAINESPWIKQEDLVPDPRRETVI